jgi:hypothetical protein
MEKKPNQKRHLNKKAEAVTPEQQAAALAAAEKAKADAKAERERVELWSKSVDKMSFHQVRGELRRLVKREHAGKPPQPQAGLTIAYGTLLGIVMDNTQSKENPFAKLSHYLR